MLILKNICPIIEECETPYHQFAQAHRDNSYEFEIGSFWLFVGFGVRVKSHVADVALLFS